MRKIGVKTYKSATKIVQFVKKRVHSVNFTRWTNLFIHYAMALTKITYLCSVKNNKRQFIQTKT